jgi:hypothetical protein
MISEFVREQKRYTPKELYNILQCSEEQAMQSMEDARKEMGLSDKDDRPLKQNMFKVV